MEMNTLQPGRATRKMGEVPLITIGITCFNAKDTIRRSVESAAQQHWPIKEIIVVDDASSDESWDALRELQGRNSELRIIRHDVNRGYPSALNTIIREAAGEVIAIFDDDDFSLPQRLRQQWERIINYERAHNCNLVLCYSNRKVVKRGSNGSQHIAHAIGRRAPEPYGRAVADYLFGHGNDAFFVWGMFGSCTLMARRDAFLSVGAFDEGFRRCAEWDFAVRAAFMGAHFIAVDDPLVTQYKTPGSEKAGSVPLIYALKLREKHKEYLTHNRVYWASRAIAHSRFHGNKQRFLKTYFFLTLACIAAPGILIAKLKRRLGTAPSQHMQKRGLQPKPRQA